MCKWGTSKEIWVKVPADQSCTGKEEWTLKGIDACISNLVDALQKGGINMRSCCCGHNKGFGDIHLLDGRILLILNKEDGRTYYVRREKFLWRLFSYFLRAYYYKKIGWRINLWRLRKNQKGGVLWLRMKEKEVV